MPAIGTALRALVIPLSCLAAVPAWADEPASRWSFGSQIGQARSKGGPVPPPSEVIPTGDVSTMSYDVSATFGEKDRLGWRVFTGYRFTDYLAVHVGYTDLGELQSRRVDVGPSPIELQYPQIVRAQTIRGVDAGLQLKLPVSERVSMEMRGGKYFWQSRTHTSSLSGDSRSSRDDSDVFYGVGMEVALVDAFSATLGWTRYQIAGDPVDLWTVGTLFRFGDF